MEEAALFTILYFIFGGMFWMCCSALDICKRVRSAIPEECTYIREGLTIIRLALLWIAFFSLVALVTIWKVQP
jgi:hypothetical protein